MPLVSIVSSTIHMTGVPSGGERAMGAMDTSFSTDALFLRWAYMTPPSQLQLPLQPYAASA